MNAHRAFIIVGVLLTPIEIATADSYAAAAPKVFTSPSGRTIVRMEAADSVKDRRSLWSNTELNVFTYDFAKSSYERSTKFEIEGHPLLIFVNDAGSYFVTLDQHFGSGHGQIAAVYDSNGKRLGQWTLKNLFNVENTFDSELLPNFDRSVGSIFWRGDAWWETNQGRLIISAPTKYISHADGSYSIRHPSDLASYAIDLDPVEMLLVPPKIKNQKKPEMATPRKPSD